MPVNIFFLLGTLTLSLNFVRFGGLAISDWFYFLSLAFALLETTKTGGQKDIDCWFGNRFLFPSALMLFGGVISLLNTFSKRYALLEMFQHLYSVTLFISLAWIMVRRGKARQVVYAFIFSGVFAAGVAVFDFVTGSNYGPMLSGQTTLQIWGRYVGPLGQPNKFGIFVAITAILTFSNWMYIRWGRGNYLRWMFHALLFLVQMWGIYLSNSLSAYLGIVLGIGSLLIASREVRASIRSLIIPAILLLIGMAVVAQVLGWVSFSASSLSRYSINDAFSRVVNVTAEARLETYQEALDQIRKNPFIGVGYDQLSTSSLPREQRLLDLAVHNTFLQIWYAGGVFAFIGWVWIYLSIIWFALMILRSADRQKISPVYVGLAAAALAVVLMDQFQDVIYQREKILIFGLVAGYAWGGGRVVIKQIKAQAGSH